MKGLLALLLVLLCAASPVSAEPANPEETFDRISAALHRGEWPAAESDLAGGFPIDHRCYRGRTLLHDFSGTVLASAVRFLLDHGADPNLTDTQGNTSLHHAANAHRQDEVIRLLRSRKADPALKNQEGKTPFDLAIDRDNLSNAELLRLPGSPDPATAQAEADDRTEKEIRATHPDKEALEGLFASAQRLEDAFRAADRERILALMTEEMREHMGEGFTKAPPAELARFADDFRSRRLQVVSPQLAEFAFRSAAGRRFTCQFARQSAREWKLMQL